MTTSTSELTDLLRHHSGSEQVFRHPLARSVTYTEGVREFAENAGGGAYWLLDILATEPSILKLSGDGGMAFARLQVDGNRARLEVNDGNDSPPIYTRDLDHTDCPPGLWLFYLCATEVGEKPVTMILLPSEY